jgi:hypothetical protein
MLADLPEWGKADPGGLAVPAPIKLILKVRDEPLLTADWIEHHAAIVGYGNLAVFDNGSTSSEMELVVRRYAGRVPFFRYSSFLDHIHDTRHFGALFGRLAEVCAYHAILDADERIVWIDTDGWVADERLVGNVVRRARGASVFGFWLQNVLGHADRFWFGEADIAGGRDWGKPLIAAGGHQDGLLCHNIQALQAGAVDSGLRNLFVLHLSMISPGLRIRANLRKLRAFGAVPQDLPLAAVLALPTEGFAKQKLRSYHAEMLRLHARPEDYREPLSQQPRALGLLPDGRLSFASPAQRQLLEHLLRGSPQA